MNEKEALDQDKNYAAKFPTFGEIVGVNRPEVQWNSLVLGELPPWSQLAPQPGKYALPRNAPQSISLFPIRPAQFHPLWKICWHVVIEFCKTKLENKFVNEKEASNQDKNYPSPRR